MFTSGLYLLAVKDTSSCHWPGSKYCRPTINLRPATHQWPTMGKYWLSKHSVGHGPTLPQQRKTNTNVEPHPPT